MLLLGTVLRKSLFQFVCVFGVALLLVGIPLNAQFTTASLGGTVSDSAGAVIPDAKVIARNTDTGFTQTFDTDAAGAYLFSRLPVGKYELRVEKDGFTTYVQAGITLTVNQTATQNVVLQVGQITESVNVEANTELVVTQTATAGQLINQQRIVDLPLNGRGAQSLVFLAAGTVNLSGRYCGVNCHGGVYPGSQVAGVNGVGSAQVSYQLDGVGHNDTYISMNLPFPNPDSLQEFNLQADNFTAEYGNAGGGIVNIVTKSGTNELHGSAFEFIRNGALNARNFFAPKQDTLKRNQFGGTIGGPIVKDKLFFFGTYQGTIVRSAPEGRISFVPTAAQRSGDLSSVTKQLVDPVSLAPLPGNQIPTSRLSPVAQYFLKNIPLPNGDNGQLTYAGTPTRQKENQFMIKTDYNLTKHQLSGRYFFADFSQPAVIPTDNLLAAAGSGNRVRVQNVSINHTYAPSATLLFNSTFGMARQRGGSLSSAPFSFPDAGVKIAAPNPPELAMSVSGLFGISTNHPGDFDRSDFNFREVVTKQARAHELHMGGEAIRVTNHIINTYQMAGNFSFSGQLSGAAVGDFLMGRASSFSQGGGEFKDLKGTIWSAFIQDNWRATQNLTLNLGLRWDPYFPYWDRQGRVVCFQPGAKSKRYPNAPAGMLYGGSNHDSGCPVGGSNPSVGNFAPRFGFAYRLTRDGKTSVRGGIGSFYTPPQTSIYNPFANIAPFAPTFSFSGVDFTDPFGSVGMANPFPEQYGPTVRGPDATFSLPTMLRTVFPKDFDIPQLWQWNLMVERQFFTDWVVRVGYHGNKGTHLYGSGSGPSREINPAIYVPGASTVSNTQSRRFYKDYSNIGLAESGNNSNYNSLQINVEKRFGNGLSILTNYTWAKRLDDVGWTNPFNRRFDYGISNDDVAHAFHFANTYMLPQLKRGGFAGGILNGWSLNSIITWQGGFPINIVSGVDNAFTGTGSQRADFLGGNASLDSGRSHGELITRWFDTSKFTPNAVGTFGNTGRNVLRGPRMFNTDFSVMKDTRMTERATIQFRAEMFNLFNNVNFGGPNTNQSNSNFGRITSAGDPRILQFGLKILF
ncbi:MAG: carboxypeptidase regulatory-like domain-containing protein [Bryobacterales bacterium]|nr:carboxypeptidase regulatory-like domain-containing protein [Bryobacterales bacterium]